MFCRKMRFVAVLALLSVATAGTAQARPLALAPASLAELWQWTVSSFTPAWVKAGGDMDPNGYKHPRAPRPVPHAGGPSGSRSVPAKAGGDMDPNG